MSDLREDSEERTKNDLDLGEETKKIRDKLGEVKDELHKVGHSMLPIKRFRERRRQRIEKRRARREARSSS